MSKDEVRKYLAGIGAKGGAKSKRKLTKTQARKMATERWQRVKAAQAGASAHERTTKEHSGAQEHNVRISYRPNENQTL